jgi:tetratricopeptide (TPR) repeat protein
VRALISLAALAAALAVAAPTVARAQDDWDVKRDPFDKRVVGKYKAILARNPGDKSALDKLRGLYRKHRSVAQLISEYKKELAKRPDDFAVLVVLGHLYLGQSERDEALAHYEKAAAKRPDDTTLAIALGDLYRTGGELDKARAAYDRALARTSDKKQKKQLLRALATIALDKNDLAGARGYFDKYIALDPADVQVQLDLADALGQHKKFDEAIAVLRVAEDRLKSDPARRVEVAARIGQVLEAAGKDDDAIKEYRRAMGLVQKGYFLQKELTERIIEIHRRKQTLATLLGELEKQWKVGSRNHFEWDVLARLYEETGLAEKALDAYRKAVAKAPFELETQRRLISMLENSGKEDEALKQYEAVIRVAPGEPRFQLELAERYWRKGQEKKALELLRRLESRFGGDAGVHSALADLYTRWGKEELALKSYERLVTIEPSEMSHLVNLGDQYFQRGDKKRALAIWKRILGSKDAAGYARLGEVYAEHDMLAEALDMYGKALKLKPKDPELYKGRASVFERQRRFTDAVTDWEKAIGLLPAGKAQQPIRRDARRKVVNLLKSAGGRHLTDRMDQWERAFSKKPPEIEAGYYLSEAHLRQGQYKSARTVLEKLLTLEPDNLDAMDQLVKVYKSQRVFDKAIALLEKLARSQPAQEQQYFNEIAEIKTLQHKDDEAIEYSQKALSKNKNNPLAHMQLALRFEEMQRYEQAIAAYEKANELDQRNWKAYFALARGGQPLPRHARARRRRGDPRPGRARGDQPRGADRHPGRARAHHRAARLLAVAQEGLPDHPGPALRALRADPGRALAARDRGREDGGAEGARAARRPRTQAAARGAGRRQGSGPAAHRGLGARLPRQQGGRAAAGPGGQAVGRRRRRPPAPRHPQPDRQLGHAGRGAGRRRTARRPADDPGSHRARRPLRGGDARGGDLRARHDR